MNLNYQKIQSDLFKAIPDRSQDILRRRFGLSGKEKETLDSIGRDLSVTRERVRQIEAVSLSKLSAIQNSEIKELRQLFRDYLDGYGGIKREDIVLQELSSEQVDHPYVAFFLVLEPDFFSNKADETVYPFWATDPENIKLAHDIAERLTAEIEQRHSALPEEEILKICPQEERVIRSCLELARKIEQAIDGRYGLVDWPEVCPQRLKDKAYLVLKETGEPLHFRKVADLINEFNSKWNLGQGQRVREALSQTVHNELIRDPRFVLVGRGLYALREWGYQEGTVRDLIVRALKETGRPMTKDEILEYVLQQRFVEKTTVLLNLSRKDYFNRQPDKTYILVEDK
jgi:hypothetical protein